MCASPCLKTVSGTIQFLKRCVKSLFHVHVVMFWSMWSIKSLPRLILLTSRLFFIFALYYLDFSLCAWNIIISRCTSHYTNTFPPSKKTDILFYPPYWWQVLPAHLLMGAFLCHLVPTCFDPGTPGNFPDRSSCSSRCDCSCPPYTAAKWGSRNLNNIPEGSRVKDPSSTALPFPHPAPPSRLLSVLYNHPNPCCHKKNQWKQGPTTFWED